MTGPRSGSPRVPALLRPEGRPRYADGAAAGAALAVPFAVGAATGHPSTGAAVALPAVLLAMPFPEGAGRAERARCLAVRAAWTTAAGVYTALTGSGVPALALGVGVTAFTGALFPRVATTAALAVLLTGITGTTDVPGAHGAPPEDLPVPGLAQLVGCAWTSALLLPLRQGPSAGRKRVEADAGADAGPGAGLASGADERVRAATGPRSGCAGPSPDGPGSASGGPERPPPAMEGSAPGARRTPSGGEGSLTVGAGPRQGAARSPSAEAGGPGQEGRPHGARRPPRAGTAEPPPARGGRAAGEAGRQPPPASPPPRAAGGRVRHATRLGALTAAAVAVTGVQGGLWGEGHWFVTSLLLTLRPTREETRTKFAKRLVGNSLGGVAAALILLCGPGPYAVAALVGVFGAAAYAFRPANYVYWSLASPVLLLLLSDFDEPVPWYATAVRVALNLAGGCVALLATRLLWPSTRAADEGRPASGRGRPRP